MVSFGCSIYWHLYCLSIESHRHHYMRYYWRVHSIGTFKLIQAAMIWSTYSFQFAGVLFFVFFLKEASRRSSSFVRDFEDVRFQKIEWIESRSILNFGPEPRTTKERYFLILVLNTSLLNTTSQATRHPPTPKLYYYCFCSTAVPTTLDIQ